MTGGVGADEVSKFYQNHFIYSNPPDMKLSPISRTVGTDRIVDELILSFTHTTYKALCVKADESEIDWILPGVPPTGKVVKVPLVAIVNIRGGKLYHEHIYWYRPLW
jgi:carboxymethylenebutenolidase